MSISKGLILYKAPRHHGQFPLNIKYGYYSDKILVSVSASNTKKRDFRRNSHQKLIKELKITLVCNVDTDCQVLRLFSRLRGIKKCLMSPHIYAKSENEKNFLAAKVFQDLFKALKRIKHLKIQDSCFNFVGVQKNLKTDKSFRLLRRLESLTFQWLGYSQNTKSLDHLLNIIKLALKYNSWPNFKTLTVNSLEPECYSWKRKDALALESLQNLLKFLQDLKASYGDFYQCFNIEQLTLPYFSDFGSEQAESLREISKIISSIKSIDIGEFKHFSKTLEIFQHSTSLKRVSLEIKDHRENQEKVDLDMLNRMIDLQEFEFRAENKVRADLTLHSQILAEIQTLTKLTAFSFDIGGGTILTQELKIDLARVITSLQELKSLKLKFWNRYGNTEDFVSFSNLNFGDIFEAIGTRTKLETLHITICAFSNDRFVALRRSLKKLEQLSEFYLARIDCEKIEEKEIIKFWEGLSQLAKLQNLDVTMAKSSGFQLETFERLLDLVKNNFPILSRFSLSFQKVEITNQSYQLLYEIIQKRGSLNWISLSLKGKGVDLKLLKKELYRRMSGRIDHNVLL